MTRFQWTAGQTSWPVLRLASASPKLSAWLRFRARCEAETNFAAQFSENSYLAVLENLMTRGSIIPTSQSVDDQLAVASKLTEPNPDHPTESAHRFSDAFQEVAEERIAQALAHLDPRVPAAPALCAASSAEQRVAEALPEALGPWFCSMLHFQMPLDILDSDFIGQRLDFGLALPPLYPAYSPRVWAIEVDPEHHERPNQVGLDRRRDGLLRANGGGCVRLAKEDLAASGAGLIASIRKAVKRDLLGAALLGDEFAKRAKESWHSPLWLSAEGDRWLHLALAPLGIARVQRAVLHAIQSGVLNPSADCWTIAVRERDICCGRLAVEDLNRTLQSISVLSGGKFSAPPLNAVIRTSPEFATSLLHDAGSDQWPKDIQPALLVDVSVLSAFGKSQPDDDDTRALGMPPMVVVRNANLPDSRVTAREPLRIAETIIWSTGQSAHAAAEQFLADIFRKKEFRPGQWEIMSRILQRRNTVGVLPTGSGKSICYQLSSLLQPAQTFVVAPLIALVEDQIRGLGVSGIDRCCSLSRMMGAERDDLIRQAIESLKHQFVFVTPERFQIEGFRQRVSCARDNRQVRTLVIDEVHCVSEWGHDFRPAYLRLGQTARECFGADNIIAVGLTGTASFDVLTDAAREVGGIREEDLIEADQFDRPELDLRVLGSTPARVAGRVMRDKVPTLRSALLQEIPRFFKQRPEEFYSIEGDRYPRAGLIFCPHASTTSRAVGTVAAEVSKALRDAGLAVRVEAYSSKLTPETQTRLQREFLNDEIGILVTTTAFGMGIDKSNIRFVIHYAGAKSVEAYYQEVGRAGRDRSSALCLTILDDNAGRPDETDAWLESIDPHARPPQLKRNEQDDRHVWTYFYSLNFPEPQIPKKLAWSLARKLHKHSEPRCIIPWTFAREALGALAPADDKAMSNLIAAEICRLSYLGLVRDYCIDYTAKSFLVEKGDFSDESVQSSVVGYLHRYKAPATAAHYVQLAFQAKRNSKPEHRSLGLWAFALKSVIDFAYAEIAVKRRGAMREFFRVMRIGRKDSGAMREEINYYFNSRYYRELQAHAKGCGIAILWEYAEKMDGGLDSFRHLYGGVIRHLATNPEHTVFRLLRGYCLLCHPNFNSAEATPYLDAFFEAESSPDLGKPDRETVAGWIARFADFVAIHRPESDDTLSIWILHYQTTWVDKYLLR